MLRQLAALRQIHQRLPDAAQRRHQAAIRIAETNDSFPDQRDADGKNGVDFADLLVLAQHYGQSGQNWATGDFDYDGKVGFSDLLILAQNYGKGATTTAAVIASAARKRRH